MISYEPLWQTMKKKGVSTYVLIKRYKISSSTIHSLRQNNSVTMYTLEQLCDILDCTPNDIVKFEKKKIEKKNQEKL